MANGTTWVSGACLTGRRVHERHVGSEGTGEAARHGALLSR